MVALPGLGSGLQPWCPLDLSPGEEARPGPRGGQAAVLCACGALSLGLGAVEAGRLAQRGLGPPGLHSRAVRAGLRIELNRVTLEKELMLPGIF